MTLPQGLDPDKGWAWIRKEVEERKLVEPMMAGFFDSMILSHQSFTDSLAWILASRLGSNDEKMRDELNLVFKKCLAADSEIEDAVKADLLAVVDRDPAVEGSPRIPFLYFKGFHALEIYRISHSLYKAGQTDMALRLQSLCSEKLQVDIHPAARIGKGVLIDHGTGVVIGATAVVENEVSILHEVTLGGTGKEGEDRHPKIRRGVMIGAGAKILGNIEIGPYTLVAAGSVVMIDMPSHATVAGVPAKVVRQRHDHTSPASTMNQLVPEDRETLTGTTSKLLELAR